MQRIHLVFDPTTARELSAALKEHGFEVTGTDTTLEQFLIAAQGEQVEADLAIVDATAGVVNKKDSVKFLRDVRVFVPDMRLIVILPVQADREWIRALGHLGIYDVYPVEQFSIEDVSTWIRNRKTIADVPGDAELPDGKIEPFGVRLSLGPTKERVIVEERIVGSVAIAVGGAGPRSGSTHLALSMAVWLAKEGHAAAVVECRGESLWELRTGVPAAAPGGFQWLGMDVFTALSESWLPILTSGYQYVVLDFGDLTAAGSENETEFMRCPVRFLVTGTSAWDLPRAFTALGRWKERYQAQEWNVAFNFADEMKFREITESLLPRERKALKLKFWRVPFFCDPAQPPDFREWLEPVLPRKKERSSFRNFLIPRKAEVMN